jgi:hypothetical protein
MHEEEFSNLVRGRLSSGQQRLAMMVKVLVGREKPQIAEYLDFSNDSSFLDPTLFTYFHRRPDSLTLDQLLFGQIEGNAQPSTVRVRSSRDGLVYMPNVGYFGTECLNAELQLEWHERGENSKIFLDGEVVPFAFRKPLILSEGSIEVYRRPPALFDAFFPDGALESDILDEQLIESELLKDIQKAVSILLRTCPEIAELLFTAVRSILLYSSERPFSFANSGAHGAIFLNVGWQKNAVFFLEDIIHQGSHVIFNAVTLDRDELFSLDPNTPVCDVTELDDYHGTLYAAFHGLFTQLNVNRCLKACIDKNVFSGHTQHEVAGRFADDMTRFGTAIRGLGQRKLYSQFGWELFCHFRDAFVVLYEAERGLIEAFDTANQPYIFSYSKFLERNPLPSETQS